MTVADKKGSIETEWTCRLCCQGEYSLMPMTSKTPQEFTEQVDNTQ